MCDENDENIQITVFGSIHVSETRIQEMRETIKTENPDIIAVELCQSRFDSYMKSRNSGSTNKPPGIISATRNGSNLRRYIFLRLLWEIQNRVGKSLTDGTTTADMQQAIELAVETGKPIALIDRELNETMNSYMSKVSIRESLKTISFLMFSIISLPFVDTDNAVGKLNDDENGEDVLTQVLSMLENKAPSFYESYMEERNIILADNISQLRTLDMDTVAVIGKAHAQPVQNYLNNPELLQQEKERCNVNGNITIINNIEKFVN